MSEKTNKVFPESFKVIGNFAISVAASYFVTIMTIEDWLNVPIEVYIALIIITGFLLMYQILRTFRFFILQHRASKQKTYISYHGLMGKNRTDVEIPYTYAGLKWEVIFNAASKKPEFVSSPFCPKDDCETSLNITDTYWGKYLYECPHCSFKETKNLSSSTLRNNLEKIAASDIKRETKKRTFENEF